MTFTEAFYLFLLPVLLVLLGFAGVVLTGRGGGKDHLRPGE